MMYTTIKDATIHLWQDGEHGIWGKHSSQNFEILLQLGRGKVHYRNMLEYGKVYGCRIYLEV